MFIFSYVYVYRVTIFIYIQNNIVIKTYFIMYL